MRGIIPDPLLRTLGRRFLATAMPPPIFLSVRVRVLGVGTKCVFGWGSAMQLITWQERGQVTVIVLVVLLLALLWSGLIMLGSLWAVGAVGFG